MNATPPLQMMTWDQAAILGLGTCNGFRAVGLNPATIRRWASEGRLQAVGKAPGGAHLYSIAEVSAVADRPRRRNTRRGALPHAG